MEKRWHIRRDGTGTYWTTLGYTAQTAPEEMGHWTTFPNAKFYTLAEAAEIVQNGIPANYGGGEDAIIVHADTAWNQEADRYGWEKRVTPVG